MRNLIKNYIYHFRRRFFYKLAPSLVDRLVNLCTLLAKNRIKKGERFDVLIDNTVIGHSVTHETAWIKTGWDEELQFESGYTARIPVHDENDNSDIVRSIRYLPGIYSLAKGGSIDIFTSHELNNERLTHPMGRYKGYGLFDYSLLKDVPVKRIEESKAINHSIIFGSTGSEFSSIKEQQKNRFESYNNPVYLSLVKVLGPKNSQDAYHIFTAEQKGLYCFLTMDFKLIRAIKSQKGHPVIKSLKVRVISPEEFGRELLLCPITPRAYSYHDKSAFSIRHDLNWKDSKRRKPKQGIERFFDESN